MAQHIVSVGLRLRIQLLEPHKVQHKQQYYTIYKSLKQKGRFESCKILQCLTGQPIGVIVCLVVEFCLHWDNIGKFWNSFMHKHSWESFTIACRSMVHWKWILAITLALGAVHRNRNLKISKALLKCLPGHQLIHERCVGNVLSHLHMISCVSRTRHISGFLSWPS